MMVGDNVNNLEIIRVLNRMIDNTRVVSIKTKITYMSMDVFDEDY